MTLSEARGWSVCSDLLIVWTGDERTAQKALQGNVNEHEYNMGYYLVVGIYPPWTTLVKTIFEPVG